MKHLLKYIFLILMTGSGVLRAQHDFYRYLEGTDISDVKKFGQAVWIATNGRGIFQYFPEKDKWVSYNTENSSLEMNFFENIEVSDEYVWAGTVKGLYILDRRRNQWQKKKFAAGGEYGNWIRTIYYDREEETLWIGRFINLTLLDVGRQRYTDYEMKVGKDPTTNNFTVIKEEGNSVIWMGTEAGVFRYDKSRSFDGLNSVTFINNKNGFNREGEYVSVSDIVFEPSAVWFGTDEFNTKDDPNYNPGGLFRYNRKADWDKFNYRTNFPANGILSLEITGNKIWASLFEFNKESRLKEGRGMVLVDRITGEVTKVDPDEIFLTTNKINVLYFDGEFMWIGTNKGLWSVKMTNKFAFWAGNKN